MNKYESRRGGQLQQSRQEAFYHLDRVHKANQYFVGQPRRVPF